MRWWAPTQQAARYGETANTARACPSPIARAMPHGDLMQHKWSGQDATLHFEFHQSTFPEQQLQAHATCWPIKKPGIISAVRSRRRRRAVQRLGTRGQHAVAQMLGAEAVPHLHAGTPQACSPSTEPHAKP